MRGDFRSAIRGFKSTPMVSAVAVLSLALGIGANASIFTLLNSLLIRKMPVAAPERLVTVTSDFAMSRGYLAGAGWNYAMWEKLQARTGLFDGSLAWFARPVALGEGAQSDVANGLFVSGGFFTTLGVPARYGRVLTPADDVRGGGSSGPVAVVSHAFWQRRLASDPHIIGAALVVEGLSFTIVGVTPRQFLGLEVGQSFDVALPLAAEPLIRGRDSALIQPASYLLLVMLRLKPSQSLHSATALARSLESEIVPARAPQFVRPFALAPAAEGTSTPAGGAAGLRDRFRQPLFILMAVVAFVLLIACLNLAHLSLTRAASRRREFAVRLALGASRWQVARQILIENLVLAVAGSLLGVLFARWASALLVATMSTPVRQVALDLAVDWHVIAFAVGLTFATTFVCGSTPALRASRADVMGALKDDSRQMSGGTSRFSSGLVATQIAVSLMLVVAAGLLVRTFDALATRPLGFDGDRVVIVRVDTIRSHLSADARSTLFNELVDMASRLPGVERAAASAWTPLTGGGALMGVSVPGAPPDAERRVIANFITPGWFATYGTPIVQGRDFNATDVASAAPVMLVNETFVRRFIRGGDPVGAGIKLSSQDGASRTIVGVARDAVFRSGRMTAGPASLALRDEIPPMIFVPLAQSAGMRPPGVTAIDISLRSTRAAPTALAATAAGAFASKDSNLSLMIRPLSDYVNAALAEDRIVAMLSGFFGFVGLLLAGLGVYGVTSYSVQVRRVELGIRLALGANPSGILQFVLVRVGILLAMGVIAGSLASLWLTRTLEALLYGLHAHDLTTFSSAVVVLALVGGFAGWVPARRAARTDPAIVLRTNTSNH
jgi:putative ABC transport system permease protein